MSFFMDENLYYADFTKKVLDFAESLAELLVVDCQRDVKKLTDGPFSAAVMPNFHIPL